MECLEIQVILLAKLLMENRYVTLFQLDFEHINHVTIVRGIPGRETQSCDSRFRFPKCILFLDLKPIWVLISTFFVVFSTHLNRSGKLMTFLFVCCVCVWGGGGGGGGNLAVVRGEWGWKHYYREWLSYRKEGYERQNVQN